MSTPVQPAFVVFDLQAPLKVLVPDYSPMRDRPEPPRVTLDPAPEGMVWVSLEDDYYTGMGWRRMQCIDRIWEYEAGHARLIPAETIERWEAAEAAFIKAQDEAGILLRPAP